MFQFSTQPEGVVLNSKSSHCALLLNKDLCRCWTSVCVGLWSQFWELKVSLGSTNLIGCLKSQTVFDQFHHNVLHPLSFTRTQATHTPHTPLSHSIDAFFSPIFIDLSHEVTYAQFSCAHLQFGFQWNCGWPTAVNTHLIHHCRGHYKALQRLQIVAKT